MYPDAFLMKVVGCLEDRDVDATEGQFLDRHDDSVVLQLIRHDGTQPLEFDVLPDCLQQTIGRLAAVPKVKVWHFLRNEKVATLLQDETF